MKRSPSPSSDSAALDRLPDDGVTGELVTALGEARRWNARITGLVAVAEKRGLARKQGYPSTTEWLMALSGEPASICRSKVAVAEALAQMPATREAFAAGEVSESRVRVLAQAQALAPEQFAQDEKQLVAAVVDASSQQVPQVLATWRRQTDPQAAEIEVERLRELRGLHVSKHWTGMVHLNGDLDPAGGLVVLEALRSLAEPANLDPSDRRTPAQARADALVEVCQRFLQGGDGKRHPAQVLVTIPWNTLHAGRGIVDTEAGPIGAATARQLVCDATISRAPPHPPNRCPSRWDGPPGSCPTASADSSNSETSTAPTPAATGRPPGATPTTFSTGQTEDRPTCQTSACYVPTTTPSPTRKTGTPNGSEARPAGRSATPKGWGGSARGCVCLLPAASTASNSLPPEPACRQQSGDHAPGGHDAGIGPSPAVSQPRPLQQPDHVGEGHGVVQVGPAVRRSPPPPPRRKPRPRPPPARTPCADALR